jgi:hypothetical protein
MANIESPSEAKRGVDIDQNNVCTTPSSLEDNIDDNDENRPDPGSQQLENLQPAGANERQSGTDEQEEDSSGGLDLNELCGLAENEDIKMYLDFLTRIENTLLEDDGMRMAPDDLKRLRHPPQEKVDLDDPDLWLALNLFLATGNSSQETYNSVRKAIQRRYLEEVLSYDQIKRRVTNLSGVVPLTHDMCMNTCIAYTGQFSHLESCPYCEESHYDPIQLAASNGKMKEPRQQLHTMPIGPQLQALYRSEDSARRMHYHDICTERILRELNCTDGDISSYEDFFHGRDYLDAIQEGRINEGDPILMFSTACSSIRARRLTVGFTSGSSSITIWSPINTSKSIYYMALSSLVQTSRKSLSHFSFLAYTIYLQSRRRASPFGMPHVMFFIFLTHSSHL